MLGGVQGLGNDKTCQGGFKGWELIKKLRLFANSHLETSGERVSVGFLE